MRRFRWPLQRVLDIRIKQADAMKLELARLSQQAALVRREILSRQDAVRSALEALATKPFEARIAQQQEFMRLSRVEKTCLDRLEQELKTIEDCRTEKTAEYGRLRAACETLEKLRDKAAQADAMAAAKLEQKDMEENYRVAFARELITPQAESAE
jgi:flagellar biosynthesis chaperone FliJ